jgi:hypothetical protein
VAATAVVVAAAVMAAVSAALTAAVVAAVAAVVVAVAAATKPFYLSTFCAKSPFLGLFFVINQHDVSKMQAQKGKIVSLM